MGDPNQTVFRKKNYDALLWLGSTVDISCLRLLGMWIFPLVMLDSSKAAASLNQEFEENVVPFWTAVRASSEETYISTRYTTIFLLFHKTLKHGGKETGSTSHASILIASAGVQGMEKVCDGRILQHV